jgi:nucleotide-binding universal stress UspA family protein
MSGVVCAIRGGPNSQPTIDLAISLAKEKNLPLYFLYVVNLDFLSWTEISRIRIISKEMDQMGEFILIAACDAAARKGISAEGIVRHGNVREEIISLSQERNVDYIILGHPRGEGEEDVFTAERMREFSKQLERESGAEVVLAAGGEE